MDIFISYSSKDETIAFDICNYLENNKLVCCIAPRDFIAGNDWSAKIVSSIRDCKGFVLILTENSNKSDHVASEVLQALTNKKTIIVFKIGDFQLCDALDLHLRKYHWINTGYRYIEFFQDLLKNCQRALGIENDVQERRSIRVVLQILDHHTLIASFNGIEQNIPNTLGHVNDFLRSKDTNFFLFNDKAYNINEQTDDSLGLLTGAIAYNQSLTKCLIDAMSIECVAANRFSEKVANIKSWETEARISDKAKEIIAYSFVGIIGKELGKLMAIGKEDYSIIKQQKYVEKCINIVKRCLDLAVYALLSELWDRSQENKPIYTEQEKIALNQKFDSPFESKINEQLDLLVVLLDIFTNPLNNFELPVPELKRLHDNPEVNTELTRICENIQKLQSYKFDIVDCIEAEKNLASFLKYFCFLTQYKMASVKRIGYRQVKNYSPGFVNRYIALGIDNKANVDAERIEYEQDATYSDSVLLYKGESLKKSINLFPFIIDYNAITYEKGSKICFYRSLPLEGDSLEYVFLEDNSLIRFEKKGILEQNKSMNELMVNEENMKILNKECVVDRFKEARRSILGEVSFDDL